MENIYQTLYNRIIEGKYPSNTWLREEDLAKEFNVSRTTVRRNLHQIEKEGLIEILPNRGARVFAFTVDEVEEIFEIREALELLAISIAAPSISVNSLMELRTKIMKSKNSHDFKEQTEIDEAFHKFFIEASGKRRLISMLNQIHRLIQRFRQFSFRDEAISKSSMEDHIMIINALCLRDIEEAKELLKTHLQNSKKRVISKLIIDS